MNPPKTRYVAIGRMPPIRFLFSALTAAWLAGSAYAEGFVRPAPLGAGVDEGEILLGELNCVRCHSASDSVAQRLASPGAPFLGKDGMRITPQWLRAWLADPQSVKPGTAMPNMLRTLDGNARTEAIDALVHYLISVQPAEDANAGSADKFRIEQGRKLFHSVGCVACHAPELREENTTAEALKRAQENSVPLGELARKYTVGELTRFLENPVAHRPGGRMPSLELSNAEALSLATYLLRDQQAAIGEQARLGQLKYDYFEAEFSPEPDWSKLTPKSSGLVDTVALPGKPGRNDDFGYRFTGVLHIAREGKYRFYTASDDGSKLYIDDKLVVDNGGEHAPQEKRSEQIELSPGDHAFGLTFYNHGAGYELKVTWSGPDFRRQEIPGSVLGHYGQPMIPLGEEKGFAVDPAKAARGKDLFVQLNCVACHQVKDPAGSLAAGRQAKPLTELGGGTGGCLADSVPNGAPLFALASVQKAALRQTLGRAASLSQTLDAKSAAANRMARLNCYACHTRDGVGGPSASGKSDWFKIVGEADLGEEGRMPPHLTGVGAKLKPAWLGRLLAEGAKVRPYMAARMPSFGAEQASYLQNALVAADHRDGELAAPEVTDRDIKLGWKLIGQDGLGCIACHTFTTHASLGVPALGLDRMHERLTWDWFRRYLPDPAALRPGTRMPTFWPDGQAVNKDILSGNTDGQIRAIYAYLSRGGQAEVPLGLVRGKKELTPADEPLIYRNFIEGAGSRAIGVGYPEKAHIAFDANLDRLALIWQGAFIDTARHSTDRGVGYEPPLGDHVFKLPGGPPFALLAQPTDSWPSLAGKPAGFRFKGYRLDAKRRPTFLYQFGEFQIEDFPMPKRSEVDMIIQRRIKVTGPFGSQPLWFRAAEGDIQDKGGGVYLVDGKVQFKFENTGPAQVVGRELRVPFTSSAAVIEEITW